MSGLEIRFTDAAAQDIAELRAYLEPVSPQGLRRVMDRLEKVISALANYPEIGRPVPREGVRELVEPRYGFLIPYATIVGAIFVLRVYRSKRKPLDYDSLALPAGDGNPTNPMS